MLGAGAGMLRAAGAARRVALVAEQSWASRSRSLSASTASMADGSGAFTEDASASVGVRSEHVPLPPRTVPDHILGFSCRTYLGADSGDVYPNVHGIHPAEFKVVLKVRVPELELSEREEERLLLLVGPRYRADKKELKLVSDRFPNRIDNKRYLVHLLENLLLEARRVDDDDEEG